jgi:uncharacterized protein (DUF1330 family)
MAVLGFENVLLCPILRFKIVNHIHMNLTNHVLASKEQIKDLMNYPADTPVVMVNILKFKAKSGNGDETGKEAYSRYMKNVTPLLQKNGGQLIWKGDVKNMIIGDSETIPDSIFLVQYPSVQHFLNMATSKTYAAIAHDRIIALEYGGLIATKP